MLILHKLFGSLAFKIVGLMAVLAATTAAAILVGLTAFQDTKHLVDTLVKDQVAVMGESTGLIADLSRMQSGFTEVLAANDKDALIAKEQALVPLITALLSRVEQANEPDIRDLKPILGAMKTSISGMFTARSDEFDRLHSINQALLAMKNSSNRIAELAAEQGDSAYFELVAGGDATVADVKDTLATLIAIDVGKIQTALSIRVEINVLRGVLLGLNTERDSGQMAILADISTASLQRLQDYAARISMFEDGKDRAAMLTEISAGIPNVFTDPRASTSRARHLLEMIHTVDSDISVWQDDLNFALEFAAIEAADKNAAAINSLIDTHVTPLRNLAAIDAAARSMFAAAIAVAAATRPDDLRLSTATFQDAALAMNRTLAGATGEIAEEIKTLLTYADPETGLPVRQVGLLTARATAANASDAAEQHVAEITTQALSIGTGTLATVLQAGQTMQGVTSGSMQRLWLIAAACFSLVLLAPAVAWVTIIRPIGRATRATASLASGDLTATDGLHQDRGEIGQLVAALHVFRDNLRDKARLEQEEQQNAADRARRALEEQRAVSDRALAEAAQAAERERHERDRAQAEEAERQRLRDAADAARQQLLESQNRVVSLLAEGLKNLASGQLDKEIHEPFSEGLDQLRQDYNLAVARLRNVVASIVDTAEVINGGAASVSSVAEDLSRRTENNAATLEQSSAALSELTRSVKSSAAQTGLARQIAGDANRKSLEGRETAQKAIAAMHSIAESSSRISRIVELIEGIAFQTNLLALNAGVEAARAGESGRGFAVVASEVRALSLRTTQAAQEISGLITQSSDEVERGVDMVAAVDTSLEDILASISMLSDRIIEIAASAHEQSSGLNEIDRAVAQLDLNTQKNATIVEETFTSGQTVSQQAGKLLQMLSQFTLSTGKTEIQQHKVVNAR